MRRSLRTRHNLGRLNRVITQILPAVQTVWQTRDIVRRR
jgi:hypothetical protein